MALAKDTRNPRTSHPHTKIQANPQLVTQAG